MPALLAVSFTFVNPCDQPPDDAAPRPDDTVFDVTVVYPEFQSVPRTHTVPGTFDPSEVDTVTANATGTVAQLFVGEGDTVAKDDPVVALGSTHLLDLIDIKRARVKELSARLEELKTRLAHTGGSDEPVTIEDTVFLDEEHIDEPVQKPFGDAGKPRPTPKTLKALAELIETQMDRLEKEANVLDRKLLSLTQNSPVNGVVTATFVSEGNKVNEGDKLVAISQTNPMSVTFYLPDTVASFVDKHSTVTVWPADNPKAKGTGTVYFIDPNIDTQTGRIKVKAHVSNENGLIKGGQKAKVRVATRKMDRVIVLPKRVLYHEEGKKYVFTVAHKKAKLVQVTTGEETQDGKIQIFGELRVDDPIIIDRPLELKHNSFVKIVEK